MNILKKFRVILEILLCFSCFVPLSAQPSEEVSGAFRQIDEAIVTKSSEKVSDVLQKNRSSQNYSLIENYTLKKARQLIITDNLELARDVVLVIIDNNIENFDAVELYSYIDKAISNQQSANEAAENRKRLEQEKIAARNAKSKQRLENRGNYQKVSSASGKDVYVNEQKASFSSFIWTIKLGLADFSYQKIDKPEFSSLKYGLAFGANLFRPSERIILGLDLFADAHILNLSAKESAKTTKVDSFGAVIEEDDPQEFFFSGRFVPEIAFSDFSKYLFLRAGVSANILASKYQERTGSQKTLVSPVVGLALDNISIGGAQMRLFYDYDIGHLAYEELKSAMEFGGSIMLPFSTNDKTKMGIELGVQDLLLMKEESMENRTKFTLAIGVGNVTK